MVQIVITVDNNNQVSVTGFPTNAAHDITVALGILERAKDRVKDWSKEKQASRVSIVEKMPAPPSGMTN